MGPSPSLCRLSLLPSIRQSPLVRVCVSAGAFLLLLGVCAPAHAQVTDTTVVASSPNPSHLNQSVTLTATVTSGAPGTPTGTIATLF